MAPFQVEMMCKTGHISDFPYYEEDDVQVLAMKYAGEELAMFVFLPRDKDGLREFEKELTGERLLQLIQNCYSERRYYAREVEVHTYICTLFCRIILLS